MFINLQKKALKGLKKQIFFIAQGHKTLFGAFLTLGLVVFFLYLLVINLYVLSQRKIQPHQRRSFSIHSQTNLNTMKNFTLTFAFQSPDYSTYIDESVYVVEAKIRSKTTKMVDDQKIEEWTSQDLPITQCSKEIIRQVELQEYFSHLNLLTNYCIDWNRIKEINLEGTFDARNFSFVELQFKMCNNQTKQSKECRSRDEIKQLLEQNYFSLQMSSYVIDVKMKNSLIYKEVKIFSQQFPVKYLKKLLSTWNQQQYLQIQVLFQKITKFKNLKIQKTYRND